MSKASLLKRILNFYLDIIVIIMITMILIVVLLEFTFLRFTSAYLYPVVFFLYYVLSEAFFGRTLAKVITKTRVVFEAGSDRKYAAIIRTLCRLIPFEPISFLFNRDNFFWHDKMSRSMVVNVV